MVKLEQEHRSETQESPGQKINSRIQQFLLGAGRLFRETFDTQQAETPDEVLSLDSRGLMALSVTLRKLATTFQSEANTVLGAATREEAEVIRSIINFAPRSVEAALRVYPLLRRAASEDLSSEDVRPYRSALKEIGSHVSDKALGATCAVGCLGLFPPLWVFTFPAQRLINLKAESISLETLPKAAAQMRMQFEALYPAVNDFCFEFPQPRAQLQGEVSLFRNSINRGIKLALSNIPRDSSYGGETARIVWSVLGKFIDEIFSDKKSEYTMIQYFLKEFGVKKPELGAVDELAYLVMPKLLNALGINSKIQRGGEEIGIIELIKQEIPPEILVDLGVGIGAPKATVALDNLSDLLRGLPMMLPESGEDFRRAYLEEAEAFGATIAFDAALLR